MRTVQSCVIADAARKALLCLGLIAGLAFGARPAEAIERVSAFTLSENPLGSTVQGIVNAGEGRYWAAGSENLSGGRSTAVVWEIVVDPQDPTGNTYIRFALPAPEGLRAAASGVALLEGDPDQPIVVGSVSDAAGRPHATAWTRNASGEFAAHWIDTTVSEATAIATRATASGYETAFCGKYLLPNGAWHACVWESSGEGFTRTDLGTLGGRNSEASIIDASDLIIWRVGGRAQRPDGRWIATLMEEEGIFYFIRALPTPSGAESRARCLVARDGTLRIGGEVTRNGMSRGVLWSGNTSAGWATQPVPAPAGLANNTVRSIIFHGHEGNDTLAVGTAWNAPDSSTGAGALMRTDGAPLAFEMDLLRSRTETVDNNETITIAAALADGACAGQLRANGSEAQAALFVPVLREVPSLVAASYTRVGPEIYGNLWNADGEVMRAKSVTVGAAQEITFGAAFDAPTARGRRAPSAVTLVSRIRQNGRPSPEDKVQVQVYSNVFAAWITVGVFDPTSDTAERTFSIGNPNDFAVDGGAPIHCRLLATTFGRGSAVLEIDQLEIQTIRLP